MQTREPPLPTSDAKQRDVKEAERKKAADQLNALSDGRLPTTNQVVEHLDQALHDRDIHNVAPNLSKTGRAATQDIEHIIGTFKELLVSKNQNEGVQRTLFHAKRAAELLEQSDATKVSVPDMQSQPAKEIVLKSQQTMHSLLDLSRHLATSAEFRRALSEIAQSLQGFVQNKLNKANEETPSLDQAINNPEQSKQTMQQAANAAYSEAQRVAGTIREKGTIPDEYKLSDEDQRKLIDRLNKALEVIQKNPKFQTNFNFIIQTLKEMKEKAVEGFQRKAEQVKQSANEAAESMEPPKEGGTRMKTTTLVNDRGQKSKVVESGNALRNAEREIQLATEGAYAMLNDFIGNNYNINDLVDALKLFFSRVSKDDEFRAAWNEFTNLLELSISKPDALGNSDQFRQRWTKVFEQSRAATLEKYGPQIDEISNELLEISESLASDHVLQRFGDDVSKLTQDLFLDSNGNPTVKPELLMDLSKILPILVRKIKYLPMKNIDISNEDVDMHISDLVLETQSILPKQVRFNSMTEYNEKKNTDTNVDTRMHLYIGKIHGDTRNLRFSVKKKSGLIKGSDAGLADFHIGGTGMDINVDLVPSMEAAVNPRISDATAVAPEDAVHATQKEYTTHATPPQKEVIKDTVVPHGSREQPLLFQVAKVKCTISSISLRLHETKHDTLYKLIMPFLKSKIKRQMEEAVEENIRNFLLDIDQKVTEPMGIQDKTDVMKTRVLPEWSSTSYDASIHVTK